MKRSTRARLAALWSRPATLPLDDRLLAMGSQVLETWRTKARLVRQAGGLVLLTTHCEAHLGASPELRERTVRFLEETLAAGNPWRTTCGRVTDWWRRREAMDVC